MPAPRLIAWAVHLYTALGVPLGVIALIAIHNGRYYLAFWTMAIATFIDATDGMLARRARVKQVLPHFDGAKLDDIVDYFTYVIVPMVLTYQAGLVPQTAWGVVAISLPLLASGYGFCQAAAKTSDHYFTGFPSYWNIVVLYLYVLETPVWGNVAILVFLSVMVFVPIRYLYPSRNPLAQKTTYALGTIWGVQTFVVIGQMPNPSRRLAALSLFFPLYYAIMSFWATFRGARNANPAQNSL